MKKLIDEILASTPDPLNIRKSTLAIFNNLKLVEVNFEKIDEVAEMVKDKFDKKEVLDQDQFGTENPTTQLVFILDSVNFCFWANKDQEKWTVEYPKGNYISNGWYAFVNCFERAREEGIPILDPEYLKKITLPEAKQIFQSSNSTQIPLLHARVEILNNVGEKLLYDFDGKIDNLLKKSDYDAEKIIKNIVSHFPSFEDIRTVNKEKINFYKRAQIFAYDISFLPSVEIKNLKALTIFADYKIPQILRAFGVLKYKHALSNMVDNYELLNEGSIAEVEIRSATIWACELIAKKAGIMPIEVDNVLWKMSQTLKDVKPYHRVLTTSY